VLTVPLNCIIVVAEVRFGHWLAWFEDVPHDKRAGESFYTAVTLLLDSAGWNRSPLELAEVQCDLEDDCSLVNIPISLEGSGIRQRC